MRALVLRVLLASIATSTVLVGLAIFAGQFIETDTMITNTTTVGTSAGQDDHEIGLYYVDLNKMVSVYVRPPLQDTVATVSQYGMTFNEYYVITNKVDRSQGQHEIVSTYGIHRWNPRTQTVETLFTQQGEQALRIYGEGTLHFTYNRSDESFVFFDPIDELVYAYHDGEIIPTVSIENRLQQLALSPQGERFLYTRREPVDGQTTDRLFIFDLETMESSEIEHDFVRFERTRYYWYDNDQIIFSSSGEEEGIRHYIVDEARFDHRFEDVEGTPRYYGENCIGDWLTYDTYRDGRRYYYMRNLDTGEDYDYNDVFPADKEINYLYFSEDCEYITITVDDLGETFPAFYRVEHKADDSIPQRLIEEGRWIYADRENTLIYITEDGRVYRDDYDHSTDPMLLGTIPEEIVDWWNLFYIKGGYLIHTENNDWNNQGRLILRDLDSGGDIALTDEKYSVGFQYIYPAGGWDSE